MRRLFALLLVALCLLPVSGAQAQQTFASCSQTVNISAVAAATVIAVPSVNGRVIVCGLTIGAAAALTLTITEGTGTTCGTGTTTIGTYTYAAAAAPAVVIASPGGLVTNVRGDNLCITPSASNVSGSITFGYI